VVFDLVIGSVFKDSLLIKDMRYLYPFITL
jgi:hypothetical protein